MKHLVKLGCFLVPFTLESTHLYQGQFSLCNYISEIFRVMILPIYLTYDMEIRHHIGRSLPHKFITIDFPKTFVRKPSSKLSNPLFFYSKKNAMPITKRHMHGKKRKQCVPSKVGHGLPHML